MSPLFYSQLVPYTERTCPQCNVRHPYMKTFQAECDDCVNLPETIRKIRKLIILLIKIEAFLIH
jgi:hypothetical protein